MFIQHTDAIINHPLLLRDEDAKILFTDRDLIKFVTGVAKVMTASAKMSNFISSFSRILKIRIMGRIFCHVITKSIDLCFISILSINFIYHKWIGHTPIFISKQNIRRV